MKKIKLVVLLLVVTSASLMPTLYEPGLTNPEPIGKFLNGSFSAYAEVINNPQPYTTAFPNLTFDSPLTFTPVPNDSKLVIGQRDGLIYWFENQNTTTVKNVLVDLTSEVGVVWDGGFLGLAIHPQFGQPGKNYFYIYYTTKSSDTTLESPLGFSCGVERFHGNYLHLERFEVNPSNFSYVANSRLTMFKLQMYNTTHRGGGMEFGDDGFLYLSTGDQAAYRNAQDISDNLDGGVLRLDVDMDASKSHAPIRIMPDDAGESDEFSGVGYWIPNDNPFVDPSGQVFEEYYSLGHRNPHRMTKDSETGIFYIGEIGEVTHEEINVLSKGKNYGWPIYEGFAGPNTSCIPGLLDGMAHEAPLVAFPRSAANAIIGGYVYRTNPNSSLYGKYICADYGTGEEIWQVDIATGNYELITNFSPGNIISFGQDLNKEIFILKQGTNVNLYKLSGGTIEPQDLPQTLTETGAFTNLSTLEVADGLIPYDLVDSFWSDGALKKRWMAVPNNGTHNTPEEQIQFSENGVWEFPNGTVLVKHFEYPIDKRNPSLTRKIETRFSIKGDDGNFYFLTYNWNESETEAFLQEFGIDENIEVTMLDGSTENINWRFPSSTECTSCHNNVSQGTLGPRTRYLNKDFTYPKTGNSGNQLVTLSHLGILDEQIDEGQAANYLTHTSIFDVTESLDDRVRSYLDLNCAYCHRPGTGNRANFDLRLINDLNQTGLLYAGINTPLGIEGEGILVPGDASKSILYHRTASVDQSIMMPPLSKGQVDEYAVNLIEDWINGMEPAEPLSVVARINAAGPFVASSDGGPGWAAGPESGAYVGDGYTVNTGNFSPTLGTMTSAQRDGSVPGYISDLEYEGIFAHERWDAGTSPEMVFEVPVADGSYVVNLYMGNFCSCTDQVGERVFSIMVEGTEVESDLDLVARFGHRSGGMLSYPATVSDGSLSIGFIHGVENTLVNAIEVLSSGPAAPDPLSLSPLSDVTSLVGDVVSLSAEATGGDTGEALEYSLEGAPLGITIDVSTGDIGGTVSASSLTGGPQGDGVHTVTVRATRGAEQTESGFTWTVTEGGLVVARINAAGPFVASSDGGPGWAAGPESGAYVGDGYTVNTGNFSPTLGTMTSAQRDGSVPGYISDLEYEGIFAHERWDAGTSPEMVFEVPVADGSYVVNLYMGNFCSCTDQVGERVFSIMVEGTEVESDLDLVARFGHRSGGMLSYPATVSDGSLSIGFIHGVENTLVNAIEVLSSGPAAPDPLSLSPLSDVTSLVGDVVSLSAEATGGDTGEALEYSLEGAPLGITIDVSTGDIGGTVSASSLTGGPQGDGVHTVTVRATRGAEQTESGFTWTVTEGGLVVARINAAGPFVASSDGGPGWAAGPESGAYVGDGYTVNTGNFSPTLGTMTSAQRDGSVPGYISDLEYEGIFAHERWDAGTSPEMVFEVPVADGSYVVNLYMGNFCSCTDQVGERVFSIMVEGTEVESDLDLVARFGHRSGGMLSYPATVSDGSLSIGFIHGVENTLVNAIEVLSSGPAAPDPLSLSPLSDVTSLVGDVVSLSAEATGGDTGEALEYSLEGAPLGITIDVSTGDIGGTVSASSLTGGPQGDGVHTVTVRATRGAEQTESGFTWTVTEGGLVVARINAAGPFVASSDGGPGWAAGPESGAYVGDGYTVNTGNFSPTLGTMTSAQRDGSVPGYISDLEYEGIFAHERWDAGTSPEMVFEVPVADGSYVVNLYMGNFCSCTDQVGERVFSIMVEGTEVESDLDLVARFGHRSGGMLSYPATVSDGSLSIGFIHGVENTLVNAIEVLSSGPAAPDPLSLSPLSDVTSLVGDVVSLSAEATGGDTGEALEYSLEGAPLGITIDVSTGDIGGTVSASSLTGGPQGDGVHTVTVRATRGAEQTESGFTWTVTEGGLVVARINAAGPFVASSDGGPGWAAGPESGAYVGDGYTVNTGNFSPTLGTMTSAQRDGSVPGYISDLEYEGIFAHERWDAGTSPEMVFEVPVADGSYVVNLYMGNFCSCTDQVGERVFSIMVEGTEVESDLDLVARFGHRSGGMLSYPATVSDGSLSIGFIHGVENTLVNAIEVIRVDGNQANLTANSSLDSNSNQLNGSLDLYPNPINVGQELNLRYKANSSQGQVGINIYDITGRIVVQREIRKVGKDFIYTSIHTNGLKTGLYHLSIIEKGKITVNKNFIIR